MWEKKEEAFCCFVDFKKAFDIVLRGKLWHRMEELEVPMHLRAVVHRLYEDVKVKIQTSTGISESFRSDIGVKQGCPLSPTLFGLYIDKLEEWLNLQDGEGALLGEFMIRLLLYADDLILRLLNLLLACTSTYFLLSTFVEQWGCRLILARQK